MSPARADATVAARARRRLPVAAALAVSAILAACLQAGPAAARPDGAAPARQAAIVLLKDKADLRGLPRLERRERLRRVVGALQSAAERTQRPLRALLARRMAEGRVTRVVPLWVRNAIAVTAEDGVLAELAARPEVAAVTPDATFATMSTPEPNIARVNAPAVWNLGDRGQGVVVANMDTGVDLTHADLAARWRGGSNSWFDPNGEHSVPTDISGHGTWTMSVMVGGDDGGTAVGVAPSASWIAVKIFNDHGTASSSAIHQGFQWLLDPDGNPSTPDAPQVVENSWGATSPGCDLQFQPDLQALRAAGIVPVFAAGNNGPNPDSSVSPGNNPEALAVGAVDGADQVLADSSRGPTSCGGPARTYPALVAPGANIRVEDLFGGFTSATGTSLAAPHVAGALALLLSAWPNLSPDEQVAALESTAADLGPPGPDNDYGVGLVDALAAYNSLTALDRSGPATSGVTVAPNPTQGAAASVLQIAAQVTDQVAGAPTVSNVAAAEGFLDSVGAAGSGTAFQAADGAFDSPGEAVSASLSLPQTLAPGAHTVYVRGRDAAGNWGPVASSGFVVDQTGPTVAGAGVSPNPITSQPTATLTAQATDPPNGAAPASVVAGAEWFEGADPGPGQGSVVSAADGAFDTASEQLTASLPVAGWSPGTHTVSVRARDTAGNWGPVATANVTVQGASSTIFADGFESGNTGAWSSVSGSSRLAVTHAAALEGSYGLQATIAGATPSWVQDDTPLAEAAYDARFRVRAGAMTTGGQAADLFAALSGRGTVLARVQVRSTPSGGLQLRAGARSGGAQVFTSWRAMSGAAHDIEVGWRAAASGSVTLWVDGVRVQVLTGLANSTQRIDTVRLGPSGGLAKSARGTPSFDAFASTRGTYIGRAGSSVAVASRGSLA